MKPMLMTASGNSENQDNGVILNNGPHTIICVCDGAGGTSGGREAAVLAVEFVQQNIKLIANSESCVELLRRMDKTVSLDKVAGETTCVILVIAPDTIFGASVGDSSAWMFPSNGRPIHLTQYQQKRPFIGSGEARPASFNHAKDLGKVLVATDGLLKFTSPEKIIAVCRENPTDDAGAKLIELVRYQSGKLPDDVTVALADI